MPWNKLAAIGDFSTVFPLKAIGIEVHPVDDNEDVAKILRNLAISKEFGIIFVTESLLKPAQEVMNEFLDKEMPAIITIPSISGSLGLGVSRVREIMKRAAGRDIMAEED